ncbi:ribonucleotide-diphosphate reductase subunit rnr1 [Orobanche minor]
MTVCEIKQRVVVDMAVDRGCFIDQSQSLNIHFDQPNFQRLGSLHFYAWSKGLKTGMYYLRTRAADAIKFTVDTTILKDEPDVVGKIKEDVVVAAAKSKNEVVNVEDENSTLARMACSLSNREECLACGS